MTFAQVDEWMIAKGRAEPAKPVVAIPSLRELNGRWAISRKSIAVTGSIIVHLLLLWFFVNRLVGEAPAHRVAGEGSSLAVFNLANANDDAKESASKSESAPAKQTKSEVASVPPPPMEWKLSTISVASVPSTSTGSTASNMSAGSTPSGGGGYDPYAGATPLPLIPSPTAGLASGADPAAGPGSDPIIIDQDTLRMIRTIARQYARPATRVQLILTIGREGALRNLKISGTRSEAEVERRISDFLRDRHLIEIKASLPNPEVRTLEL